MWSFLGGVSDANLLLFFGILYPCNSVPCFFCVSQRILYAYAWLILLLLAGQKAFQVFDCNIVRSDFSF